MEGMDYVQDLSIKITATKALHPSFSKDDVMSFLIKDSASYMDSHQMHPAEKYIAERCIRRAFDKAWFSSCLSLQN